MGRRKMGMELISNKRARNLTFQKRKKSLEKKANELSILCQVKLCMIIYGGKDGDKQDEATIWPDKDTARSLIDLYNARSDDDKRSRTHDLNFFFNDLTRKVQIESAKLRKKNQEAKYPTWDKRYDHFPSGRLRTFAALLGGKIEAIKQRLEYMKATQTMSSQNMPGLTFLGNKVTQQAPGLMQNSLVKKSSLPLLEIIQQQQQQQPLVGPHYQMNFPGQTHVVGPVTEFPFGHQMMMLNNGAIAGYSNNNYLENQQHPMPLEVGIRESNMLISSNNFVDPQPMCYFVPVVTPTNYFEYPTLLPSAAAAAYQMHPSQRHEYYGMGHDFQLASVKYEE